MNKKVTFILILFAVGLISRLIPHYPNFTAIGSVAILGGAMLRKPLESLVVTVGALFLSDLVINNVIYPGDGFTLFYSSAAYVYGAFFLTWAISLLSKRINPANFLLLSVLSSALFFIITNYGTWATGIMYPQTNAGLAAAYTAAIPYGLSHLAGTLVYGVAIAAIYKAVVGEKSLELAAIK